MRSVLTPADDATALAGVIRDPVRFCRGLLRQDLWPLQEAILRAIASRSRVAVKACHASGKTFVAAVAVLWFVTRYRDGIVVTTAPTWTQVEKLLWGEIHRAAQSSRIAFPLLNKTELRIGPGNYAIGLSTNEGVRFQGFHGRVLIVVDEAPGVKADIWEAVEGIRAGGDVRVLALGNPTIASGPFHDAFTSNREGWCTFTISAFDSPNLTGLSLDELLTLAHPELDHCVRPYLVTRRWVREKYAEWGPGHPLWEARVLGQFPTQAEDALISLAWLEDAARRPAGDRGGRLAAGLDVAGPGEDETVLVIAEGEGIVGLHVSADQDPRGAVVAALAPYRHRLDVVNVDAAGIGYYLAKHLQDLGYPVRPVNVGERSSDRERYANLKAEFYWGLRQRFQAGDVAGLMDERTIGQLAGIRYRHTARGQVEIERKEDARKRGVKSPDRAEAVMLAFARPAVTQVLLTDHPIASSAPPIHGYDEQLRAGIPWALGAPVPSMTCARCAFFDAARGWCTARKFETQPRFPSCEAFEARPLEGAA
jgi:hypothetical protein